MIELNYIDVEIPGLDSEFFYSWISKVLEKEGKQLGDIAIVFCSDDYLLSMNKQYLNHDYYTDIITFDYSEQQFVAGDLFISSDRVKENAAGLDLSFNDELNRVVIHGVLHLCGYKDKTKEDELLMRAKEDFALSLL